MFKPFFNIGFFGISLYTNNMPDKKQILIIHGGTVFDSYGDYLNYLRQYKIESLVDLRFEDWKRELEESLADRFEIIKPSMPCKRNAKYLEWVIWLEKFFPFLSDDIILIGHSLGGTFWLKYLAENNFPVKISQLHLVAAAITETNEPLGDFVLPEDLSNITGQVRNIFLYHSKDDPVVPFSDLEIVTAKLPEARKIIFADRGHFRMPDFVELKNNIINYQ